MTTTAFRVKIPVANSKERKEVIFLHRLKILEFLNISQTTFYSILNNKMKFVHPDKKHLRGISIEKILIDLDAMETPPVDAEEDVVNNKIRDDFLNSLMQKVNV